MSALTTFVPLALEGEWADWRAVAVVVISVIMLIGTIYMLLWSNLGARVGYLVLMVSLAAWCIMLALIWLVGVPGTLPATGPRTHEPKWIPFLAESEVGREFRPQTASFPNGWDAPGKIYAGNIDSRGEIDKVEDTLREALARRAAANGLEADEPEDWEFRLAGEEAITEEDRQKPIATVRFFQSDTPLLFGITIAATDKHPETTVFARRDKGATYLTSLYFLILSLVIFVSHLWLLGRHELKQRAAQAETAPA